MKKILVLFLLVSSSIIANAQFLGGFGCADPDAWFNKEIYFYCQNNANNGYYGLNLSNVSFVINDLYPFDVDGVWVYGDYIFIGNDQIKFSKGDKVSLYINGYHQGSWECTTSNPSAIDVAKRIYKNKPRTRMSGLGKSILKLVKRIR